MKHPRKRVANRGYQLSAEAAAFLSENRPVPFQLTAKALELVNDHSHGFSLASVNYSTPPVSKGEQLEMLMECADRLHKRWQSYYDAIYALPENDLKGRNAAFARLELIHKATSRLSKKIQALILELP